MRKKEIEDSLADLQKRLDSGAVAVKIGPRGEVCFTGWGTERNGVTDACAYLKLKARGSWALQKAVAKAESMAGRKVSAAAVRGGGHSHDGGNTWGSHSH